LLHAVHKKVSVSEIPPPGLRGKPGPVLRGRIKKKADWCPGTFSGGDLVLFAYTVVVRPGNLKEKRGIKKNTFRALRG